MIPRLLKNTLPSVCFSVVSAVLPPERIRERDIGFVQGKSHCVFSDCGSDMKMFMEE